MTALESPIVGLTFRVRELGRLRMGEKVDTGRTKNGRPVKRPEKLDTYRLTSKNWRLIQRAAELYGGKPSTWADAPGWNPEKQTGPRQFQVTVTADAIPVSVPGDLNWSQTMEAWSASELVRRCNGDVMEGGEVCACREDADEGRPPLCQPYSRVNLILPELPGWGFWRLESHGWEAAREFIPMVVMAARFGPDETYQLRIDQRTKKGKDEGGKPVTYQYGVPVLDTDRTPAELYALAAVEQAPALEAPYASGAGGSLVETPSTAGAVAGSNPASVVPVPDQQSAPGPASAPPGGAPGADLDAADVAAEEAARRWEDGEDPAGWEPQGATP